MLQINELSFWEKKAFFEDIDFLIIGAGIVGMSTALFLRKKYKNAKICILERGYLPTGASTKNAGFTCFGSPTELFDDLKTIDEQLVWDTFANRYYGLQALFELVDKTKINYDACKSWDLIAHDTNNSIDTSFINYINEKAKTITGVNQIYFEDKNVSEQFGFKHIQTAYCNELEGAIDTGKLIQELFKTVVQNNIDVRFGIEAQAMETHANHVNIKTKYGLITAVNCIIATNGFAKQWIKDDIKPARAQVLVTNAIKNLKVKGTFHFDKGFYYFRNIGNRILLGGGRNLNFDEETTVKFGTTSLVQDKLQHMLKYIILPQQDFSISHSWSGIMGVGKTKKPIIKQLNPRTAIGVRLGGMGVALGSQVGKTLASYF